MRHRLSGLFLIILGMAVWQENFFLLNKSIQSLPRQQRSQWECLGFFAPPRPHVLCFGDSTMAV